MSRGIATTITAASTSASTSASSASASTPPRRTTAPERTADEPPLRRMPIPLREPHAAMSVAPGAEMACPDAVPVIQGTLALALPWESSAAVMFSARDRRERPSGHEQRRSSRSNRPVHALAPVPVLPEPKDWAATFIQAAMEVAMGLRPPGQLVRWTTPEIQEALARRGALVSRALRRSAVPLLKPAVRAVLICTPAARICEASAVIADPEKIRAAAFRMEGFQARWRVTVLDLG